MRRYRLLLAVLVFAGAVLGALSGSIGHRQYTATASVVLEDPRLNAIVGSNDATSANYVTDQVAIMKLPVVLAAAATTMAQQTGVRLDTDDFLSHVTVTNATGSDLVTVSFRSTDRQVARSGANAELQSYEADVRASEQAQVKATLANIDQAVANLSTGGHPVVAGSPTDQLRQQLLALRAEVVANGSTDLGISADSAAALPSGSGGTGTITLVGIGAVVGLLIGAVVAYLLAARRPRLASRFDPELVLGAPLLGEIANFRSERLGTRLPARDRPRSDAAEAFRFASSSVAIGQAKAEAGVVAVISASAGDGKTVVAANLAVTRAREGLRVLVIDADLEHQKLTSILLGELDPRPGLVNLLDGLSTISEAIIPVQLGDHVTLSLLTGGTRPNKKIQPVGTMLSRPLLDELQMHFDLVIIDTPAMLTATYAARMALDADLRLVVVRHNSDPSDLQELGERLDFAGVGVLGYIYNCAPQRHRARRPTRSGGADRSSGVATEQLSRSAAAMTANSVAAPNWSPSVASPDASRRPSAPGTRPSEQARGR